MKRLWFSSLACLAVIASACGPSSQPAPSTQGGGAAPNNVVVATPPPVGTTTTAASTAAPAAQPTAAAQPATQASGPQEITINALQGEPDNLDPNRSTFATEAAVVRQVFEPLLVFDKDLRPAPGAASSYDVTSDGKVYTFHLRQGARWSDGQPVTARDFVYSFKRLLDPATAADYASFFTDVGIVGAAEFNAGKGSAEALGVVAKDDNTLEITLDQPSGYFPNLVALWVVAPLRQDVVEKSSGWAQDASTYIGNGAFKMSEWVHQDHITLVPNPNYNGPKPNLSKVTFLMVTSNQADYAAYLNNERDWTLVPDADVAAVRADPQLSKEAHEYTELTTFWLVMNNAHAPLDNPLVRKAFARGIDREAMIRDVAAGVGKPATSFIPPGMPGFQPELGQDLAFDPTAAKDLLRQAGFADPSQFPQLKFRFATTSANQSRAEFIQAQLKQNLGINIQLESMEAKAYQAAYKDKDYDLAWTGWGADYPDPQNWISPLFACEASNNKYNYCNPEFDAAANKGDIGTDLNQRLQAYAQAQSILIRDVVGAPLFYRGRMVLVKPWVQNLVITAKDDYPGVSFLGNISVARH
jgi:oligopeptide transport system substrate-binding protein